MAAKAKVQPPTLTDVRAWLAEQELSTATRGRISAKHMEAFNAAHKRNPYVPAEKTEAPVTVDA